MYVRAQSDDKPPGQVAPELVGKWCYLKPAAESIESLTNSCITLNADGTYELNLDRSVMSGRAFAGVQNTDYGTWSVQEGRIFYNSSSQGKGSMRFVKANNPRLDNTPTVILEGAVFCPASPRDPW